MQSRIRDIRRAKGLTLADVAARCTPPTTAVTIGRLEVGARTLTLPWVNRIAGALEVSPNELLQGAEDPDVPAAALVDADGAEAPTQPLILTRPTAPANPVGVVVEASIGDYRAGDQLWCEQLPPERFAEAVNMDVIVPRPAGRFAFGRLAEAKGSKLTVLPPRQGARAVTIADAPWLGVPRTLIRRF